MHLPVFQIPSSRSLVPDDEHVLGVLGFCVRGKIKTGLSHLLLTLCIDLGALHEPARKKRRVSRFMVGIIAGSRTIKKPLAFLPVALRPACLRAARCL